MNEIPEIFLKIRDSAELQQLLSEELELKLNCSKERADGIVKAMLAGLADLESDCPLDECEQHVLQHAVYKLEQLAE